MADSLENVYLNFINVSRRSNQTFAGYLEDFHTRYTKLKERGGEALTTRYLAMLLVRNANLQPSDFHSLMDQLNRSLEDNDGPFEKTTKLLNGMDKKKTPINVNQPDDDDERIEKDLKLKRRASNDKWLSSIPREIWIMILGYLSQPDLATVSKVCYSFRYVTYDSMLWTTLSLSWKTIKNKEESVDMLVDRCNKLKNFSVTLGENTFEELVASTRKEEDGHPMESEIAESIDLMRGLQEDQYTQDQLMMDTRIGDYLKRRRSTLESVSIQVPLSPEAISILEECKSLKKLEVNGNFMSGGGAYKAISQLKDLTSLSLYKLLTHILPLFAINDSKLKQLKAFELNDCYGKDSPGAWEWGFSALFKENPQLESFVIANWSGGDFDLSDDTLKELSRCRNLRRFELGGCEMGKITDKGICCLAKKCPQLKKIILPDTQKITDKSLESIANNTAIEHLEIQDCLKLTDDGVRYLLENAKNLQKLSLRVNDNGGTEGISEEFYKSLAGSHPNISIIKYKMSDYFEDED